MTHFAPIEMKIFLWAFIMMRPYISSFNLHHNMNFIFLHYGKTLNVTILVYVIT
jgi:hypothetical protein